MQSFLSAAEILLPLGYLAASIAYGLSFFGSADGAQRLSAPLLRLVLLFHLITVAASAAQEGQLPATTVPQALSLLACAVAAVYMVAENRGRDRSTGFWLVGVAFLFQLLASLLSAPQPSQPTLANPYLAAHVALALVSYAAFAVAAVYGFLFLRLYRELKQSQFSTFYARLPPLEVLERMLAAALWAGLASLTLAVAFGIIWATRLGTYEWWTDPKILATLGIWVLYTGALVLRRLRQWQGQQTAVASLAGMAVILISLLTVNVLFSGFHQFQP